PVHPRREDQADRATWSGEPGDRRRGRCLPRAVHRGRAHHLAPARIWSCRPGDRGADGVEESPDTEGQDARASEAAKADGKWHREETATRTSPEVRAVRVKRWGKSPPAPRRRGGSRNPVRCKANRARNEAARPGPG